MIMTTHTIKRDSRGRVGTITGTCGSTACPVEDEDDDGSIEYRCPVTDTKLAEVNAVDDPDDVHEDRRPSTVAEIQDDRRRTGRR